MPLIHGGWPPSNSKKYSQVLKPPRVEVSASIASSSSRSGVHVRSPLLDVFQCALALPKLASGWIWRPLPA